MSQQHQRFAATWLRSLLRILFAFATGFLALVWQTTALRIAIQEIGANRSTSAAILGCSLLGLAIGAAGFGWLADRTGRPERLTSVLLLMVAVATNLLAFFGRDLAAGIAATMSSFSTGGAAPAALVFAFLIIVPVHSAIGGIIPSLMAADKGDSQSGRAASVRRSVSALYAFETIGAAIGGLLTVFQLIPTLGIFYTLQLCGLAGVAVSIAGLFFFRNRFERLQVGEHSAASVLQTTDHGTRRRDGMVLLLAVLLTGFASLGMELVWQSYFVFVFGSDSRSYAVVVAVLLSGLSMGSWLAGLRTRLRSRESAYALSLATVGGSIGLSLVVLHFGMRIEFIQTSLDWLLWSPFFARFMLALAVMLLPSVAIGFAFPVASELWTDATQNVGGAIGKLYGTVAVGNVTGVFICAAALIPILGLHRTAVALAILPLVASLLIIATVYSTGSGAIATRFRTVLLAVAFAAPVVGSVFLPTRAGLVQQEQWSELFYVESSDETVAVLESRSDPRVKQLLIDGVTIGESGAGVDEKQQLLAHLPILLNSTGEPKDVYTIGLGSGILASELASLDQVGSVVVTELSKGVIEAIDFFSDSNQSLSTNQKVQIVNDDGIRFLKSHRGHFDAIVSDGKSRPGAAANIAFFSSDYYRLCERKLTDEGLFIQWVSTRCDQNELKTILGTFAGSFPHGYVGFGSPGSLFLVGCQKPLKLNRESMQQHLASDQADSLKQYGWRSADDFLSMYWLDQKSINSFLDGDLRINSFDRPVLERYAWDSFRFSVQQLSPQLDLIEQLAQHDLQSLDRSSQDLGARAAGLEILKANRIMFDTAPNWLDDSAAHWKQALKQLPDLTRQGAAAQQYRRLARSAIQTGDLSQEFSALLQVIELNYGNAEDRLRVAMILESYGAFDKALEHHDQAVRQAQKPAPFRVAFAQCLMMIKKFGPAKEQLDTVIESRNSNDFLVAKAKLLRDICDYKTSGSNISLLRTIALRASEHEEFEPLLQKFEIRF